MHYKGYNERQRARVLVLDFQSTNGVGLSLRDALASSSFFQAESQYFAFASLELEANDLSGILQGVHPSLVILVIPNLPVNKLEPLCQCLRQRGADFPIFAAIDNARTDQLLALFEMGMIDFITPPFDALELEVRIRRLLGHLSSKKALVQAVKEKIGRREIVGESPVFLSEMDKIMSLAKCDVSVLISGETGTGKELVARSIHYLSQRADRPFVPINCGAIPLDLLENELFGHEKGAYTGAYGTQSGLVKEADSGTLFLDEVFCLPLSAQVKLLRFIQEKEYRPIGSTKVVKADVRIVAASNGDFKEAIAAGKIRQDLYYRLNVMPIVLPPLRERVGDIALLAEHFLAKYSVEFNKPVFNFTLQALQKLELHDWPGNIRELEHVIERAVLLCDQQTIKVDHILLGHNEEHPIQESFQEMKSRAIRVFEKKYIEVLLSAYKGNITKAARAAQKERRTFWGLIRKHNIDIGKFKPNTT